MRSLSLIIATAFALAMSNPVAGEEPAWVATVEDPVGDLSASFGSRAQGPVVADLVGLSLAIDGDDLLVRFETAGEWDAAVVGSFTDMVYTLLIDGDRIAFGDVQVHVSLDEGHWTATVAAWALPEPLVLDDVSVTDASVIARVPLSALGGPADELLFRAETWFSNIPEDIEEMESMSNDDFSRLGQWFDLVPDARDERLTLDSGVVTWTFEGGLQSPDSTTGPESRSSLGHRLETLLP